ncbi:MAG: tripartite tricarboxylate transporter substrate binding protein BugD, partial [Xanthobacteraceae bacterium]
MPTTALRMIIVALLAWLPTGAGADDSSARPIRMIVAFAPGGTTDFVARLVAERASAALGRSIV